MKYLTQRCRDCENILDVKGKDVDEIIAGIDKSGWLDFPETDHLKSLGRRISYLCPECRKIQEDDWELDED